MARAIDPETLRPFDHRRTLYERQWRGQPHTIGIPSEEVRSPSSTSDLGMFLSIGEAWAQLATKFMPNGKVRVLDIGCGCGKVARFLYLNPLVEYVGVDAHSSSIEWCKDAFAKASPRFSFEFIDVYSPGYNDGGSISPSSVTLPVETASFDMIIAASLFTHLAEPAFERYLHEVERCLTPDGHAIVSIHTQPIRGRFWDDIERVDIAADLFVEMLAGAGLKVREAVGNMFGQQVYVLGKSLHAASEFDEIPPRV